MASPPPTSMPRQATVEDSHNGILSGKAAGMRVIAIPNRRYPPGAEALAAADEVLDSITKLTPERIEPDRDPSSRR